MSLITRVGGISNRQITPANAVGVDYSHSLSQGLVACYVPGMSFGVNLAQGGGELAANIPSGMSYMTTTAGMALSLDNTNHTYLSAVAPPDFINSPHGGYSCFWFGKRASATVVVGYPILAGISYSNAQTLPYSFLTIHRRDTSATKVHFQTNQGGTLVDSADFDIGDFPGTLSATVVNADNLYGYQNGALVSTVSMAGGSVASGTLPTIGIGYPILDAAGVVTRTNASTLASYIWNRPLSSEDHKLLSTDPFIVLKAKTLPPLFTATLPVWWSAAQSNIPVIGAGTY